MPDFLVGIGITIATIVMLLLMRGFLFPMLKGLLQLCEELVELREGRIFGFLLEWLPSAIADKTTLEFATFLPLETLKCVVSFRLSTEFFAQNPVFLGAWLLRDSVRCGLHTLVLAFLKFSVQGRLVRLPIGMWL